MNPRIVNWILGLIALGAIAFAGFMYMNQVSSNESTATPSLTPLATATLTTEDLASPSPTVSLSPSPNTSNRTFSEAQGLSVPNELDTIPEGGSLSTLASAHGLSVTNLAKINGIADVNKVYPGQSLIVPDSVSDGTYTLLYILNGNRLKKEQLKTSNGGASIYSDPVSSAQADVKGIFGLGADTPYSKSNETLTGVTLSSTLESGLITIQAEKHESGFWLMKKVVIKPVK